jgi:hypothetical protein
MGTAESKSVLLCASQALGDCGGGSSPLAPPQHGRKEIIGPLEIEYAEKEMDGHEHHGPMPESTRFGNFRHCHLHEYIHNERIQNNANEHPGEIKEEGNEIFDEGMNVFLAFVQHASQYEKPGIDFYRQAGAHEPSKFWPGQGA